MPGRWMVTTGADRGGRRMLDARAEALGLTKRLECRAFTLLADEDATLLVNEEPPVAIIGPLFERSTSRRVTSADPLFAQSLAAGPGRHFSGNYWGSYVALVGNEANGEAQVFRDPSGAVPVYWTKRPSLTLVCSDARLLMCVVAAVPRVDFASIAAHLQRPGHHGARTCVEGVNELLPGSLLLLGRECVTEDIWRPWELAGHPSPDAAGLEATVDNTIHTLATCHRRIVVTVSGGLDSSIVAASLARQNRPVSLLTIATSDPRGDERRFAALIGEATGFTLGVDAYDHGDIALDRSTGEHQAWPSARTFAQGYDMRRQAHAAANGADAIFSGDGGDNVFCLMTSASPVIDRWRTEGMRAAFATAHDMARLTSCSLPAVLRAAIARRWRGDQARWTCDRLFMTAGAFEMAAPVPWHPWLDPDVPVPPGKRTHIAALLRTQKYRVAYMPGPAEAVLPLLAQPIMESCLATPSWRWCTGGENRALARAAFADRLPPAIVHRRTKGGPDSFCVEIVERNRKAIGDMLLGGLLAGQGLIDVPAVERSLASGAAERGEVHRMLALVDAEAWARRWHGVAVNPSSST